MRLRAFWMTVSAQLTAVAALSAQPWVPPPGEGTVSLTYQNYYVLGHYDVAGRKNQNGATHAKAVIAEVDVGLSGSLALTISLPFIATKYTGPDEYRVGGVVTHPGPLDDRKYHGAFQDFRIEARRVFWAGPVAIAPLTGVTIPTHDYETHGEAVVGRHRRELQIGAAAGADLNHVLPRAYVHGKYALAMAERISGFPSIKSNVDIETGVDLSKRVAVRGLAAWQIRHKGPTIPELAAADWLGHDRFIVSSYFDLGGGVTVSMTKNTELHALWVGTIKGKAGAHRARTLSIGTSWSFGSRAFGTGFGAVPPPTTAPSP